MHIQNIETLLQQIAVDPVLNRKVAFVTGDDNAALYAIVLLPSQSLPAHYHKANVEIYYILQGEGLISIKKHSVSANEQTIVHKVKMGDAFSIQPNEIHEIKNTADHPLKILAIAPQSHNSTDRFFVNIHS